MYLNLQEQPTRREIFLEEMQAAVPWERFEALICPHYPAAGIFVPEPSGGAAALCAGGDAAHSLPATMVRLFRPGDGGGVMGYAAFAALCRD